MTDTIKAKLKRDILAEFDMGPVERKWKETIDQFYDANPTYRTNKKLNEKLDATVKRLAGNRANRDRSGKWFLEEAHRHIKAANSAWPRTRG